MQIKDLSEFEYRFLGKVTVKGRKDALKIYEILDGLPDESREKKSSSKRAFEAGLELYFLKDFSEAMGAMFSGLFRRKGSARGEDLRYTISITLEQVATGLEKDILVPRQIRCNTCDGEGELAGGGGGGSGVFAFIEKLTAADPAMKGFGRTVAIDGDTVVATGARYDDDGGSWSDSTYVFRTTDGGAMRSKSARPFAPAPATRRRA